MLEPGSNLLAKQRLKLQKFKFTSSPPTILMKFDESTPPGKDPQPKCKDDSKRKYYCICERTYDHLRSL
jgi:hypothetical protein